MNFSNTFKPSNTAMLNFQKTNYLKMYLATWDFSYFKISDYTLFWYILKVVHCISIFSANLLQTVCKDLVVKHNLNLRQSCCWHKWDLKCIQSLNMRQSCHNFKLIARSKRFTKNLHETNGSSSGAMCREFPNIWY